ncbi:multidrug efflux SMR transporter, partial [Desulfovibrio sp.]|uniref:DMT family transporter n=1 Tax=Desulfovibrio sp. TaxID=885 RepID=UPI0023CD02A3
MGAAWLLLFIGIVFEVSGTTGMRALAASHPGWSLASATVGIVISYFFASRAMETIPVGLAYAVWSGVGLAGISLLSWLLFAEAMPPLKLAGLALVTAGMVAINLAKREKGGRTA